MPDIFNSLLNYVDYYPLVAFLALLLAGLNLPISEELIIITGALVSHEKPSIMIPTLIAIFAGIFASDFFVYWIGTRFRKGAIKSKFFTRFIPKKAMDKMHYYLDKYGILTFIIGRFVPFGIRNTLFFSSGLFNLRFRVFALYDIIGAIISINVVFFLTYHFGGVAAKPIMIAGLVLLVLIVSVTVTLLIRFIIHLRKKKALKTAPGDTVPADLPDTKV